MGPKVLLLPHCTTLYRTVVGYRYVEAWLTNQKRSAVLSRFERAASYSYPACYAHVEQILALIGVQHESTTADIAARIFLRVADALIVTFFVGFSHSSPKRFYQGWQLPIAGNFRVPNACQRYWVGNTKTSRHFFVYSLINNAYQVPGTHLLETLFFSQCTPEGLFIFTPRGWFTFTRFLRYIAAVGIAKSGRR